MFILKNPVQSARAFTVPAMPPKRLVLGKSHPTTAVSNEFAFKVPGTPLSHKPPIASSSSSSAPLAPKRRKASASAYRNVGREALAHHGSVAVLREATGDFGRVHLRPIAPATQRDLEAAERHWLSFFTIWYGSEKDADASLVADAPMPPLGAVKQFFHSVSTLGRSGLRIPGRKGWSVHTTRNFVKRVWTMVCLAFLCVSILELVNPTQS